MSDWSPPTVPSQWLVVFAVVYGLLAAYSVVFAGQLLLGVVVPAVLALSLYLLWRFLAAVEAIADALQRIADRRERDHE